MRISLVNVPPSKDVGTVARTNHSGAKRGDKETVAMRSILLWLIGVPIPIILLLAFCTHHL